MKQHEIIGKIRDRIEQCRRLARSTNDRRTADALNQMAEEGEADIARILAEKGEAGSL